MEDHGEEIFADLLSHYGIDMRRESPGRVLSLVRQLPPDSRYARAVSKTGIVWGDPTTFVLADLYDAIMTLTTLTAKANSKKPKQVPDPTPYPRPGMEKDEPKKTSHLLAMLRGEEASNPFEDDPNVVPLFKH